MATYSTSDRRSPSTNNNSSSKKDNMENKQKFKFLPVRTCEMDFSMFGFPSVTKTPKQVKYAIPVRTCDMDPSIFEEELPKNKKPVRKQLWSVEKKRNSRCAASFKPDKSIRKSVVAKPLPNSVRKIFQDTENKKSETKLPQPNKNLYKSQRTFEIPKIKVNKPEPETNLNMTTLVAVINNKFDELSKIFDSKFKELINNIELKNIEVLNRLSKIESTINCSCKNGKKKEDKTENEDLNNYCNIVEDLNIKEYQTTPIKLNFDFNRTKKSTPEVNNLIDKVLSSIETNDDRKSGEHKIKDEETTRRAKTKEEGTITSLETSETPNTPLVMNKRQNNKKILIDSNKKLINKFEILESKFKYGSPMSDDISLSDTDSPGVIQNRDINWLINDKTDSKSPLFKSLSASSIVVQNKKKTVSFHSETNLESDTVSNYNEMRRNVNFLCTPKNTKIVANLMTPSAKNSQTKMLSRQIQKQLLLLE